MSERSPAQIEASQRNGALSNGPKTEEGKAISSRNSTTHGLLANSIVIEGESHEAFQDLLDSMIIEWNPFNFDEYALVEAMAVARWRQMRAWSLTTAGHNHTLQLQEENAPEVAALDMPTRAWLALCQTHQNGFSTAELNRHETRYGRDYLRYRRELIAAQHRRKKETEKKQI